MKTTRPNPLATARAAVAAAEADRDRALAAAEATDPFQALRSQLALRRADALANAWILGGDVDGAVAGIEEEIAALEIRSTAVDLDRTAARHAVDLATRRVSEYQEAARLAESEIVAREVESARRMAENAAARFAEAAVQLNVAAGEMLAASRIASQLQRRLTGRSSADNDHAVSIIHGLGVPDLLRGGAVIRGLAPAGEAALSAASEAAVERLTMAGVDPHGPVLTPPRVSPAAESESAAPVVRVSTIETDATGKRIARVRTLDDGAEFNDGPGARVLTVG